MRGIERHSASTIIRFPDAVEDKFEWQVGFHFLWFELGCVNELKILRSWRGKTPPMDASLSRGVASKHSPQHRDRYGHNDKWRHMRKCGVKISENRHRDTIREICHH